jgi:uncharacterized protein (DUF1778 family)
MPTYAVQPKTARAARIEARVSAEQKTIFERAAEMEGVTLTDFVISSAQRAAAQVFESHAMISLSSRDQHAFIDALMNPPEPNPALRSAAKRYLAHLK